MAVPNALLLLLLEFLPCFTRPGWAHFCDFVLAHSCLWAGPHTVTEVLRLTGASHSFRHWTTPYAFLRRGRFNPAQVYDHLLLLVCRRLHLHGDLIVALDDTPARKSGQKIPATGFCPDPTDKNPGAHKRKIRAHCWLVAALLHERAPGKWMAFPFAALLFIPEAAARTLRLPFSGKLELAARLARRTARLTGRRLIFVVDNLYAKAALLECTEGAVLVSRLRSNAALYRRPQPTGRKGRPAKRGEKVTARQLWESTEQRQRLTVSIYGKRVTITAWVGQLIPSPRLSDKPVLAMIFPGRDAKKMNIFFTTEVEMTAERTLEIYGGRFRLEDAFDELKTWGGFEDCRLRSVEGIERHACLTLVSHTLLKVLSLDEKTAGRVETDPWWKPKGPPSATRMRRRCHKDFLFPLTSCPEVKMKENAAQNPGPQHGAAPGQL